MEITKRHLFGFAALRVSLGFLLVWWGIARILDPSKGVSLQAKYYFGLFPSESLQYTFGFVEAGVGALVILGLFRKFAMPAQLTITGFSTLSILPALIDPLALFLPISAISPGQLLFYPSMIALSAGVLMFMLRKQDRFALDNLLASPHSNAPAMTPAE